jgi:uncharacterized repeat protein (TIGR01451 family)
VFGTDVNWGSVVGILRNKFDLDQPVFMEFVGNSVPMLALDKEVSPSSNLLPGQPLTFTLTFSNPGLVSIGNVGIADAVASSIKNVSAETDLPNFVILNQTGDAPNLSWEVDGLFDSSDDNIIYIRGVVDPLLSVDTTINNSAAMSGTLAANVVKRTAQASANVVVPRLQFAPDAYAVQEDGGSIEVTVTMDKANPFAETNFTISTQGGSAKAGDDFVALSNLQVTIPAGATSAKFSVQIVDDGVAENDQAFAVVLQSATAAALGATKSATITIENDDAGQPVPDERVFLPSTEK